MTDSGDGRVLCSECTRLRERYARATGDREWAKADLIAATFRRDASALKAAQSAKEHAVREWEVALAELQAHLATHNQNSQNHQA